METPVYFSPREKEILELIWQDCSNAEIAAVLEIETKTVEGHISNMIKKSGVRSRVGLVKCGLYRKFLTVDFENPPCKDLE